MACGIATLASDGGCGTGGFTEAWIGRFSETTDIAATSGVLSGITMASGKVLKKITPDDDESTASYTQDPGGPLQAIEQTIAATLYGINQTLITGLNTMKDCCDIFCIVRVDDATKLVFGLEVNGTSFRRSLGGGKFYASVLSGTSAERKRIECTFTARSKEYGATCSMTDSALDALM